MIIGTLQIPQTPMVRERSHSVQNIGSHASTMTLYTDHIEWDIPTLDETVEIGLEFEGKTLVDYDGVFSLPKEAVKLIRQCGYRVPRDMR